MRTKCVLQVCVSDASCMRLCEEYGFPCYDFQYSDFHPVNATKRIFLLLIRILIFAYAGQRATFCAGADRRVEAVASSEGVGGRGEREHNDCGRHWPILQCWLILQVDILMLDLDVGFMDSPLKLLDLVLNDSSVDILVQVSGSIAWSATLVGLIICL
jgi:hypothetical protein